METTDPHTLLVEQAILANNKQPDIKSIKYLECLYSSIFSQDHYKQVVTLIKKANISDLLNLSSPENSTFNEYLELYSFSDQHDRKYFTTIYDSDELYQNPQVIEIFEDKKGFS